MQVITTHVGTDFDALSSMIAAKKLYPEAKICFPGFLSGEVKRFLIIYGKIIQSTPPEMIDLQKVSRLIIVDTKLINRIGIFSKLISKKCVEIHIYDHHPPHPKDIKGDWGVCKEVGATITLFISLIKKRGIFITPIEATLFLLGIYEDTGSLIYSSTTPLDLEAANFLLSQGANLELISSFLNRDLNEKQTRLLNEFLKKAKTRIINGVEVVIISAEADEFIGGFSLPLHKFIDLKNLEVVFALIKSKERIYLIARSRTPSVNVGEVLSFFGGGGHNFAASALIREGDIKEIEEKLYQVLEEIVRPHLTVGELIKPPARTISPYASIKEAKDILEKYSLETLPVIDKGKFVGAVSRERIEHLISHNAENIPLKNYISQKIAAIPAFFSIKKAQEIMIENKTKDLMVFDSENKFIGVLSGLDLLNAFHSPKKSLREYGEGNNLEKLLGEAIPLKIQNLLRRAGRIAQELGYRAFIVGGFVRDLLLRIENLDIDLVIEGDGISFANVFAQEIRGEAKYHKDFGTATIILPDGFKLDTATSRREFYPAPAVLPKVEPAPLREDLLRRDFTVNTMAIDLSPSCFGQLIDFFKGREDLKQKKVRVLHSESFIQDPTRIFRAIRFEQRYNFILEERTQELIEDTLKKGLLDKLSRERVRDEFIQILEEDRPDRIIQRMQELGVLRSIHPQMELTEEIEKKLDSLIDVFAWVETLSGERVKRWLIRLLLLLENLDKDEVEKFCRKYRFNKEERDSVIKGRLEAERILKKLKSFETDTPSSIYYLLQPFPREVLLFAMAKTKKKIVKKKIFLFLSRLESVKTKVSGDDLKKIGYKPSPKFKEILEEVKKVKLDGLLTTKKEEMDYIKIKFSREEK